MTSIGDIYVFGKKSSLCGLFLTPDAPVAAISVAPFSVALVIGDAVITPGPGVRQMLPVFCDGKVGWAVVMWMRRCETVLAYGVCWGA